MCRPLNFNLSFTYVVQMLQTVGVGGGSLPPLSYAAVSAVHR